MLCVFRSTCVLCRHSFCDLGRVSVLCAFLVCDFMLCDNYMLVLAAFSLCMFSIVTTMLNLIIGGSIVVLM